VSVSSALSRAFAVERLRVGGSLLPALLVMLSAAIPWAWAPNGFVVAGIDTPPNVDFSVLWKTTLHTWDPAPNGGISNFVGYGMFFPYFIAGSYLQSLGVSPHAITLGALSFAFAVGTLGFYIFTRELGASAPVPALLAVGYTLNLGHTFEAPGSAALFAYAALPWVPLAVVWAARRPVLRQIAIGLGFALASTGLVYIKINPPTYVALFGGGALLALLALRARALRVPLAMLASFTIAFVLMNLWWIADFVLGVRIDPAAVTAGLDLKSVSADSTLAQILLLGGSWAFDPRYDASPYFAYAEWYRSGGVQFLLALAPACVVAALVVFRNLRAAMWTLAAILVLVFLDAGYHPPFGWAFTWMFEHVPFFWLYREPLTKFDGVLAVVYVSAFAFLIPQEVNVHRRRVLVGLLTVASVGFVAGGLPLAGGAVVRPAIGNSPGFQVRVPDYWLQFGRWANEQSGGRIAMLPQNGHYELQYDWGYLGADIDGMLLRHPFIDITPSAGYTDAGMKDVEMEWYRALARPAADTRRIRFLSDALDIQYTVVRRDVQPTALSPVFTPESTYLPRLRAIGFHRVRRFGELDVYERQCCVQVSQAQLRPVSLVYANAMPVQGWYSVRYGQAVYAPGAARARKAATRWMPGPRFIFGTQGFQTNSRAGIRMWSALGEIDAASVARVPGQSYFVAIGGLLAPIVDGMAYHWHQNAGLFNGEGHIVSARLVAKRTAQGVLSLPPDMTRDYGLVTVRPLSDACSTVTVDGGADPMHLVPGHSEGSVIRPYDRDFTARVLRNGRNTIVVSDCGGRAAPAYEVSEYAITAEQSFILEASPKRVTSALQYGARQLVLAKRTNEPSCHCVLSYAALPLRAPDTLRVELPPAMHGRTVRIGLLDSSGIARFFAEDPSHRASPDYEADAGNVVVACACGGATPIVRVTLQSAVPEQLAFVSDARANVRVSASSETGSDGTYDAASLSAVILPQSFSNGWRLTVDGHTVAHFATVTRQNAWVLPAGTHRYHLTFWLEDVGAKLQLLAEITAAVSLMVIVAVAVGSARRTA
jgi:hypothetical protein